MKPIIFSGPMVRAILEGRKTQTRRVVKTQPDNICPYDNICPCGEVSDILWVKETWASEFGIGDDPVLQYRADGDQAEKWKSPRYMPRRASRITLEITNIRIERLQEISYSDVIAEGIRETEDRNGLDLRDDYANLWDSINGPGSWDTNSWVWVIEFRRQQ